MEMKIAFKRKYCCRRYQKEPQFTAMVAGKWVVRGETWQQSQKAIISKLTTRFTNGFRKLQVFLFFFCFVGALFFVREWVKFHAEYLGPFLDLFK